MVEGAGLEFGEWLDTRRILAASQLTILSQMAASITMAIEEFDEATKKQFMTEDSEAWNSICAILISIISVGLLLAILAVSIIA